MKDTRNIIIILIFIQVINSLFRRFILSHSRFEMLYLFFSRSSKLSQFSHHEDPSNHYKDSPCVFNVFFLSFDHSFCYRSSSSRFYVMVHQGFNSFSKFSSRFFSKELKHSSSCNLKSISLYRIILGGVMLFLMISPMWFLIHMLSRLRYLK